MPVEKHIAKYAASSLTRTTSKRQTMVCDLDEVLVETVAAWFIKVLVKYDLVNTVLEKHLDMNLPISELELAIVDLVGKRKNYMIVDFMQKELGCKLSREEIENVYLDHEDFYNDLHPTSSFAKAISSICSNKDLNIQVVILSHYPNESDPTTIISSKAKFVKRFFPYAELHHLEWTIPKSEFISEHYPNYSTFCDDRLDIIEDVMFNTYSRNKEFMMPNLGYNEPTKKTYDLITERKLKLIRFEVKP